MIKKVLNKGEIELVQHCGSDLMVVNAARASYGRQVDKLEAKDINLLKRLITEGHLSTLEHTLLTFRVKAPIFIARQWMRHRVGCSYNERSGRYCEPEFDFFIPDNIDMKGEYAKDAFGRFQEYIKGVYDILISHENFPREIARAILPQGLYTNFFFTCNLRSFLHFYGLRSSEHAQKEIRVYANAMLELIKEIPGNPFENTLKFFETSK